MGRDVLLLYMSPKNPNYKTQTNEGAVRYLIKEKETPDCILALCSETVRKKAVVEMPDGSTGTDAVDCGGIGAVEQEIPVGKQRRGPHDEGCIAACFAVSSGSATWRS